MRKLVLASLVAATAVAGCATVRESRVNPFNWFGRSQSVAVQPQETEINPLIPKRRSFLDRAPEPDYAGSLVQTVTELDAHRTPGGALIEATGIFRSIASYDVRLIQVDSPDPTTLAYEFRAVQPRAGQGYGTAHARTVTAAIRLTDQELEGIRTIRVTAQTNVRTTRR